MPDPISFTGTSARFALPLLFPGQAQKEFYVNEALGRIDALLHCAVEGETDDPPASPNDGESWLVGASPTAEWAGHPGEIACRQAGNWLFAAPDDGTRLFDRASGQFLLYRGGWVVPGVPGEPSGGTTVDGEARAAIADIVTALRDAGLLPAG